MVDGLALCRIVSSPVNLEEFFDAVEHRLLGSVVRSSELFASLEHKVLEIVCKAGGLCRVVLASHLYCDISLDARFLLIYRHIHFETIVKGVKLRSERIPLKSLIPLAG